MSLLKNLGNKAINTAKAVGYKSQDMVEISKYKMQITQLESELKKLKYDIGDAIYYAFANNSSSPSEQVVSLCTSIHDKYGEIEETKIKIDEVKND